jgi:hypothetical protein
MNLQEQIIKVLKEEAHELKKNSVKDSLRKLIDDEVLSGALQYVGGVNNLVKILYDGDIMKFYEETGFTPIRISSDPNLHIDDLIVQKLDLPSFRFAGKDGKHLGEFSRTSGGITYKFYAHLYPITYNSGQKMWRVVGQSGDYGFGYSFITKKNMLGKSHTTATKQKISDSWVGRDLQSYANSQSHRRKKVIQYSLSGDIIKVWDSVTSAVKYNGQSVCDVIYGRQKTAYGCVWKLLED